MPSILTHPAVPLSVAVAYGRRYVSARLLIAAIAAAVIPDLDSIGFRFGVPYGRTLGHRGLSHSLFFALCLAGVGCLLHGRLHASRSAAFAVIFISCSSHGVLDALTTGGLGVAFLSPFSNQRYFLPWRPIAVSPLSVERFFSDWGLRVIRSEVLAVWLPCALVGFLGYLIRRTHIGP